MKKQRCTVCFADIGRFNVATRNMNLDEIVSFLQGFYERAGNVLLSHNGRLVKYLGDGILMIFDSGREEVAVRAMWALRQSFSEYVAELGGDAAVAQLRAGVATGEAAVGQMGHPQMLAYDVVGRPAMLAAGLLQCGGITIDRATHEAVAAYVEACTVDSGGELRGFQVTGLR